MRIHHLAGYRLLGYTMTLALLSTTEAQAGLYKCQQPDGQVIYQQTACGGHADAKTFDVDIQAPSGAKTGPPSKDYSVAAQAAEMRAARERREEARRQSRIQAEVEARRAAARSDGAKDRAKCAKHRGEVEKWTQKLRQGYKKRSEKEYNESKLAYHEALVERYCP